MLFLALAVACSLSIAVLLKVAERRDLDRTALLTANYAAAAALALGLQGAAPPAALTAGLVGLGVVQGVLFIAGFWLFSRAIRDAGMGLAAGVMRLSVVVPFVASWLVWGEVPRPLQLVGLALSGGAFFLVARPAAEPPGKLGPPAPPDADTGRPAPPAERMGAVAVLGLLFAAGGVVDVNMKLFQESFAGRVAPATFLLFVFGVAFAVGLSVVVWTGVRAGRWPRGEVLGWGAVLGIVNYGSAEFLLRALDQLPGPVAFPANSVAIVFGAALIGRFLWHERLSAANVAGIALAGVALVLLAG
ncbi:hypothetical protein RQM47_07340 [Rubrivirga sp. S365]|uniref:EamA-like transporter family protein n=1 Tax=Rubrivirga litoralis TaxID=3075598 RepID=A0ABU3BN99_9BACT|nr:MULTISPECIES: hypothetical protein [unclassified Rubrivirga]MDT0630779.1 hypothetical protein [Rubrivirga sp. F394]MDT7856449.1 hypothetical protein [Rubrivirga sp. S365]